MTRPLILLVGSGHPTYREYLMAAAAEFADLWLLENDAPTWQWPYLTGFTRAPTFDPCGTRQVATELAQEHKISGVFCYHEGMIVGAAAAAEALGLPGPKKSAVEACRDKASTRQLLSVCSVAQPRAVTVTGTEVTPQQLAYIGLPAVVKPRSLGASQGVVRVDRAEEFAQALSVARSAHQAGMINGAEVLVEQYIEGPEISVDGYFDGFRYVPLFIARKTLGLPPFFEEVGHTVDGDDPLLDDEAFAEWLGSAHAAIGMNDAITHTEVRLGAAGPVIIEINGRLGGDLIPYLAMRASGIDVSRCAVDLSLGRQPPLAPRRPGFSAIRFLCPARACRVRSVRFDQYSCRLATGTDVRFAALAEPGSVLRLPPEDYAARYAFLIVDGKSAADCERKLETAAEFVRLDCDELL